LEGVQLIGSKEHYEKIQKYGYAAMVTIAPVEISPLLELIDALRKVAQYAEHTRVEDCASWEGGECNCGLANALDVLPEWIKE
jgi:hypothetical protein